MTEVNTSSSSGISSENQIRVLSLNVWGLKYISKLRFERIQAITSVLKDTSTERYDFIALQEMWYESKDWRFVKQSLQSRYPYSKFFFSGAFGSGLAILSKWPILETCTHPYSLNGTPIHVHQGDWFVGKACGCITVDHPKLGLLDVWNTHLVAAEGESGPESRRCHRVTQAYELATHCRNSASKGRHVICMGDLNSTPPSLSIALLRQVGGMYDSFLDAHPSLPEDAVTLPPDPQELGIDSRPDPKRAIRELGITCDNPLNTWFIRKDVDDRTRKGAGHRLDYVLYRGPATEVASASATTNSSSSLGSSPLSYSASQSTRGRLVCHQSQVVFTELCPTLNVSYSDHFGVESIFDILPNEPSKDRPTTDRSNRIHQTLTLSLHALVGGYVRSRSIQRTYFYMFSSALFFAIALIISSVFQPLGGVNPIFVLLAVVAGWAGTTMLYSAVVWSEWEKRALRNAIERMEMELNYFRRHSDSVQADSLAT